MGTKTTIEWTEATWNPVRGCSIVSEGCRNCYAMRMAHRSNRPGGAYEGLTRIGAHGPTWSGDVRFVPELLDYPLRLRKPHRIFVNSMSDLFHESLDEIQIGEIFATMAMCPQHTFQILTKRPERMCRILDTARICFDYDEPLPNVMLGVSVENQQTADERIPWLLKTPAAVRWISAEPLLGPINLERWLCSAASLARGARPMHPDWVRSLREQCRDAHVPFFFKQWGYYLPLSPIKPGDQLIPKTAIFDVHGERILPDCCSETYEDTSVEDAPWRFGAVGKKKAGNLLDGRQHLEYPA